MQVTDAAARHLAGLTVLTNLSLEDEAGKGVMEISDDFVCQGIATLTALRRLSLSGVGHELTDAALLHLSGLAHLDMLDLTRCHGVVGHGITALQGCTGLKCLQVAWGMVNDVTAVVELSAALSSLTRIFVAGPPALEPRQQIVRRMMMEMLFRRHHASLAAAAVPQLPTVRPSLRHLHVAFSQLTDSQLAAALQSMPHLRTLIIGHCDAIGDEGLSTLTAVNTELRHLHLVNCGVTDAAVLDIAAKLERLSTLNVSECGGVSAEGAAAVRSQLESDTPDLLPWQRAITAGRHVAVDIQTDDEAARLMQSLAAMQEAISKLESFVSEL